LIDRGEEGKGGGKVVGHAKTIMAGGGKPERDQTASLIIIINNSPHEKFKAFPAHLHAGGPIMGESTTELDILPKEDARGKDKKPCSPHANCSNRKLKKGRVEGREKGCARKPKTKQVEAKTICSSTERAEIEGGGENWKFVRSMFSSKENKASGV